MKKRKFEGGGSTDDGITRKRGLRSGTGELVLDSQGMPILTVGEPDKDTEDAIAKAKLRGGSDTPSTKRRNFLSRLFGPRRKSFFEEYGNLAKQNLEDRATFDAREVEREIRPKVGAPFAPRDSNFKKGGSVTRGDGIAKRGKTKGRYI